MKMDYCVKWVILLVGIVGAVKSLGELCEQKNQSKVLNKLYNTSSVCKSVETQQHTVKIYTRLLGQRDIQYVVLKLIEWQKDVSKIENVIFSLIIDSCPVSWIQYGNKCYYFSNIASTSELALVSLFMLTEYLPQCLYCIMQSDVTANFVSTLVQMRTNITNQKRNVIKV